MVKFKYGNNPLKIKKYNDFWNRESVKRPLVGFSFKSWFPFEEFSACNKWSSLDCLTPEMIKPCDFINDQKPLLEEGEIMKDDIFRGASPFQAVPWLCAMLGSKLKILPKNVYAEEQRLTWNQIENIKLDYNNPWFKKYIEFLDVLIESSEGNYPISHKVNNGPSDLAAKLRGHSQSILDLIDYPERARNLLLKLGEITRDITEKAWERIPNYFEGYFDAQYYLWAPGPIVRVLEDATALYSPKLYREFLQPVDRELARHFSYSFIHIHPTSLFILDAFLEIEELRCFQINKEENGPQIKEMIPFFKMVQNSNRSLIIRGSLTSDELKDIIKSLDPKGLYLYIIVSNLEEVKKLRSLLDM